MKRLSLFFISVTIAVSGLFTSCTDDTDTSFDKPTIEVKLGGTDVTGTVEKTEGSALVFEVKFSMGAAEDKLTKIRITSQIGGKTFNVVDSVLDAGIFNSGDKEFVYTYNTSVGTTEEKLTFYTEDSKNRTQEEVITIKPLASGNPTDVFVVREAILMGSYSNTSLGSCYSVDLNKVLTLSAGFSQQSSVDIFYFYGATNKATLSAPSNADLTQIFTNATNGIAKWTTKNATKFKLTTVTNFATITEADFTTATTNIGTAIKVNDLAAGNILAFETASGKKGLIRVDQVVTGPAGSIKITIKMKK